MIVSRQTLFHDLQQHVEAELLKGDQAHLQRALQRVADRYGMTPEDVAAAIQPLTEDEACPQS